MDLESPPPLPKPENKGLNEEDYVFISLDKADLPREGVFEHYVDYFWLVHPEKGLAFWNPKSKVTGKRGRRFGSPQCNSSKDIAYMVAKKTKWPHEVRQIPLVFVPIDIREYQV